MSELTLRSHEEDEGLRDLIELSDRFLEGVEPSAGTFYKPIRNPLVKTKPWGFKKIVGYRLDKEASPLERADQSEAELRITDLIERGISRRKSQYHIWPLDGILVEYRDAQLKGIKLTPVGEEKFFTLFIHVGDDHSYSDEVVGNLEEYPARLPAAHFIYSSKQGLLEHWIREELFDDNGFNYPKDDPLATAAQMLGYLVRTKNLPRNP